MRPTARGYGAIGITLATLLLGAVLGNATLWPLTALGVSCLICSIVTMLLFSRKASHNVSFSADRAHRNEKISLTWEAAKSGVLPRQLRMHTTQGSGVKLRIHGFSKKESHEMIFTKSQRGTLSVTSIDETIHDPLQLIKRARRHTPQAAMTVWPARWDLSKGVLRSSWERPEFESPSHGPDAGVRSLRGYVTGDDPRHLNWKASARYGSLIVAERTKDTDPRVLVVLDTQMTQSMLDFGADAACSIVDMLSREGAQWNLLAGEVSVESSQTSSYGRYSSDLDEAFDALAMSGPSDCSLQDILDGVKRTQRIVITTRSSEIDALDGVDVVVLLHNGGGTTLRSDSVLVVEWDVRRSFQEAWEQTVPS
jgi:uncharacterized protein (DUF58 family)